jgi:hypothetical protein
VLAGDDEKGMCGCVSSAVTTNSTDHPGRLSLSERRSSVAAVGQNIRISLSYSRFLFDKEVRLKSDHPSGPVSPPHCQI